MIWVCRPFDRIKDKNENREETMRKLLRLVLGLAVASVLMAAVLSCAGCGPTKPFVRIGEVLSPDVAVVVKFEGSVTPEWLHKIESVVMKSETKLLVLWLDSPGGTVQNTKLLAHGLEVLKAKYNKPIWVYSEYMLASGAYWVACGADSIFASPVSLVGSIGVYIVRIDATSQDSMIGLRYYFFTSGARKMEGSPHTPLTIEEWMSLSNAVRPTYVQFVNQILVHRFDRLRTRALLTLGASDTGSVVQYTLSVANGAAYTSDVGYQMGLIDGVYYFDELCDRIREMGYLVRKANGDEVGTLYHD